MLVNDCRLVPFEISKKKTKKKTAICYYVYYCARTVSQLQKEILMQSLGKYVLSM